MSNIHSKYKTDIIKLREEGKSYKEISEILGCSFSIISYHTSKLQQETARETRRTNKEDIKLNRKFGKTRNRQFVTEYLKQHPCVDCGNSDIRVLEFDHINDNKESSISWIVKNAWSLKRLIKEINKCEVRCCNCHRIITIERRHNQV